MSLAIVSAVLLTSVIFALGGFINALFAKNFDQISWFPTFVLTPLTYLGGVFYSITMLPDWAHIVSHANPILYMVSAFRYGFLGTIGRRSAAGLWDHGVRRRRDVHAGRNPVEPRHRHPRIKEILLCELRIFDAARARAACRHWLAALSAGVAARRTAASPLRPIAAAGADEIAGFSTAGAPPQNCSWSSASMPIFGRGAARVDAADVVASRTMSAPPHDKANAEFQLAKFREWGWDASIETFSVLYPTPREVSVELVAPTHFKARLTEPPIAGDSTSSQTKDELPAYNVYGADGDVTAELVYVNHGMPDDYKELERQGVSVKGRIVLTRYGGGWRGLKAEAGL